jgi:hypothetical protein
MKKQSHVQQVSSISLFIFSQTRNLCYHLYYWLPTPLGENKKQKCRGGRQQNVEQERVVEIFESKLVAAPAWNVVGPGSRPLPSPAKMLVY